MNMFLAVQNTGFADRLSSMMWQAYGKPIKIIATIAVVVVLIVPVVTFLRRLVK